MDSPSGTRNGGRFALRAITAAQAQTIRREVLRDGDSKANVVSEADSHPAAFHVGAFSEGALIGVATSHPAPLPGRTTSKARLPIKIQGVAVRLGWQRYGVGTSLINALFARWDAHGVEEYWATSRVDAIRFYYRCGFHRVGKPFTKVGLPHVVVRRPNHSRRA
jgi:GNAT superfamily N-acetyltransferase